jgi:hypothetical protein
MTDLTVINDCFSCGVGNFTVIDGTWGVVSNSYQITTPNVTSTTHLNNRSVHRKNISGDFTLRVEANVASTAGTLDNFAVIFGYQDSNNYYFFSSNESNDTTTNGIFKVVAGVTTELVDASSTITSGTTYRITLMRVGNVLTAYRNDVLVATVTDSTYLSGKVGLGSKSSIVTFNNLTTQVWSGVFSGAKPGPSNTGPNNPGILSSVGSLTITTNGALIENVYVTGGIFVKADNVTIRNFKIDATGNSFGINAHFGHTGTIIEDGEIFNPSVDGLYGTGYIARRLNIHDCTGDGFKHEGDGRIESSWVHHVGLGAGAHADGVQIGIGANIVIDGNFFDMPFGEAGANSNSSVIVKTDFGDIDNVTIQNNWCNGGNFTIFVRHGTNFGVPTNVRILNNRFGRDYQFGLFSFDSPDPELSGNVWDDTGDPVP